MPVIEVEHLTKEYRLGALQSLKQTVLNVGARIAGKSVPERPLFRALDDVNFTIEQGEVVGIIGHNGAGKSTLLKMLSNISRPTRGAVSVRGRVAPLIEVGAGFVPDFTGRENVYLNGAILGMRKREIAQKLDEIIDFAEMEQFIDTPVKRYSSGMQVKLAFAVATSIESEILIVDEVLAVGDLAFQRKCFDRMEDLIKRRGNTVLLVSHNIRQVQRLCARVILLANGRIASDGEPKTVCEEFYAQSDIRIRENMTHTALLKDSGKKLSNIEILKTELFDKNKKPSDIFKTGDSVTVEIQIKTTEPLINPIFSIGIHTTDFLYLGTERSENSLPVEALPSGIHQIKCTFHALNLLQGVYSIRASIVAGKIPIDVLYSENLSHFQVLPEDGHAVADMRGEGFFKFKATWELAREYESV